MTLFRKQTSLGAIIVTFVSFIFLFVVFPSTVSASTLQMPNPADFIPTPNHGHGNTYNLVVSRLGSGNNLDAPASTVVFYFTQSSSGNVIRIHNGAEGCNGGGTYTDGTGNADTTFYFYNVNGQLVASRHSNNLSCSYNDIAIPNLPGTNINGKTVYKMYATATNHTGSINSFSYQMVSGHGRISYFAGQDHKFAIQDRHGNNTNHGSERSQFNLRFAPSCNVTSNTTATLRWFDSDAESTNNPDIYFQLFERRQGQASFSLIKTVNTGTNPSIGFNNELKTFNFTARPNAKYIWRWHNVRKSNGIQFRVPYDSFYFDEDCTPPAPTISISTNCTTLTLSVRTSPTSNRWAARIQRNVGGSWVDQGGNANRIPSGSGNYAGDGTNRTKNIRHLFTQNSNYTARVRIHNQTTNTTYYRNFTVKAGSCRPVVTSSDGTSFSGNCQNGLSLKVDTRSGGTWVARLHVDSSSTYNNPSSLNNAQTARVPTSGSLNDGASRSNLSIQPWYDIASHTFRYIVYDEGYGNGRQVSTTTSNRSIGPCLVPTCEHPPSSLSFDPSNPEPNEAFSMTFVLGFKQTFGSNNTASRLGSYVEPGFTYGFSYHDTGPSPGFNPATKSATSPNNANRYSATIGNIRAANAGTYYGEVTANPNRGPTITCSFGTDGEGDPPCLPSNDCDFDPPTISASPFFQAFRGDVIAGASLYQAGTCSATTTGQILAYNEGDVPDPAEPDYKGSGGQLGVLAYGSIPANGFISASLRTVSGIDALKPQGLTFANTGAGPGNFGGMSNSCSNYFAGYDATSANGDPAPVPSTINQDFHRVGDITTSNGNNTVNNGKGTIYVNGNLYITRDIVYKSSFNSIDEIPRIRFVVKGDIFIHPSVTRLDGMYIALPKDDGTGGNIFTCAPDSHQEPDPNQLKTTCVNAGQLKFFGSVIAKNIHLHRLRGTMNDTNPNADYDDPALVAGEVFIESPLSWLIPFQSGTGSEGVDYEAASNLPPIL